jgi:hypothetical protein
MSGFNGRRTSAAAAIRFCCSAAGNSFGEPFGNHSRFQVVTRTGAPRIDAASANHAKRKLRMLLWM